MRHAQWFLKSQWKVVPFRCCGWILQCPNSFLFVLRFPGTIRVLHFFWHVFITPSISVSSKGSSVMINHPPVSGEANGDVSGAEHVDTFTLWRAKEVRTHETLLSVDWVANHIAHFSFLIDPRKPLGWSPENQSAARKRRRSWSDRGLHTRLETLAMPKSNDTWKMVRNPEQAQESPTMSIVELT
jgi:hypothetical protein